MADKRTETNDLPDETSAVPVHLLEKFNASPVVDIVGVVNALGAGGGQSRGETWWTLRFRLVRWKRQDGAVQRSELLVQQFLDGEALRKAMNALTEYRVVALRVRLAAEDASGSPKALLLKILDRDSPDVEMRREAEELQRPVTLHDDYFGELLLDRRFNDFTVTKDWRGKPVDLSLSMGDCQDTAAFLRLARELWEAQDHWHTRITEFAVAQLLPLKNDNWLDEDEEEVSPKEFADRMELTSISLNPDGSFTFWHNDGDLFWGHCIQISGSMEGGPTDADIPG